MHNHYKILGLTNVATSNEIRRAYRILARRYHPDLSSDPTSPDKFKLIAEAYHVLNDQVRRAHYDIELEAHLKKTQGARLQGYGKGERPSAKERFEQTQRAQSAKVRAPASNTEEKNGDATASSNVEGPVQPSLSLADLARRFTAKVAASIKRVGTPSDRSTAKESNAPERGTRVSKISIIEASVSVQDAIRGVKKTVEIDEPSGPRKLSVAIPPGVRSGSVVRLRAKSTPGEELILIVRVASHPFISVHPRGIVVEIPITIQEALYGASITVPTLDQAVSIKIPQGAQSGHEVRLRERGVMNREGPRGDIFYRLMISVPESPDAVGLREKAREIEQYYGASVRANFSSSLITE